jgi:hypothetical protein
MEKFKQEVINEETFKSEGIIETEIDKELVDVIHDAIKNISHPDGIQRLLPTNALVVKEDKTIRIGVTERPLHLTPENGHKLKYAITIEYIGGENDA